MWKKKRKKRTMEDGGRREEMGWAFGVNQLPWIWYV